MAGPAPPPRERGPAGPLRDGDVRARLRALSPARRALALAAFGIDDAEGFDLDWGSWAHDGQLCPPGDWATWVLMAGRGFGKTRAGAEWVAGEVRKSPSREFPSRMREGLGVGTGEEPGASPAHSGPPPAPPACGRGEGGRGDLRIALVAATIDEARRIMVDGVSGLLAVAEDEIESFSPTRRLLKFRGGAEATLFSGASPEALRGPEHHFAWRDELAKWDKPGETWDMLQLGLRLGERPRVLVTTTPRPGPVLRRIMAAKAAEVTGGPTRENPHLPAAFVDTVHGLYAGTRLARQELEGELLADAAGALWTVELLERCRVLPSRMRAAENHAGGMIFQAAGSGVGLSDDQVANAPSPPPTPPACGRGAFARTVIGVDPPAADGTCGIVACARDADGIGHVLADHSVTARSPEGWARAVAAAAEVHGASLVVAEANQGGRMVESVLRAAACPSRVKLVRASEGKSARADPVATLFEARRVRLRGRFPELEAELCGLIAGGGYEGPGVSPDRADAMVWALTELMLGTERGEVRVRVV